MRPWRIACALGAACAFFTCALALFALVRDWQLLGADSHLAKNDVLTAAVCGALFVLFSLLTLTRWETRG